jgi:transposase-like protein
MARFMHRDLAKERRWRRLVRQQRRSGLSVRAFCEQHEVCEHSFYWWRRELADRDAAALPADKADAAAAAPLFLPVHVRPDDPLPADGVEILLANGRRLRFGAGVEPQRLAALAAALEAPAC